MATAWRKSDRTSFNRSPVSPLHLSIGHDLDVVLDDRKIKTSTLENKNRRTIIVKRENGSFGFTLQSYGLRRRNFDETELLSYVDYVEFGGPAQKAGMRAGDVILSVNGESMENADHSRLVNCIQNCQDTLRMVVLFEDVSRKIELHSRYFKLKQILAAKMYELRAVVYQEAKLLEKVGAFGGVEESLSITEMSDISSSLGSAYYDCEGVLLAEQMLSSPNVFYSSRELRLTDRSPEVTWLGSSLELPRSSAASRSPNIMSSSSPFEPPHSAVSLPPDFGYINSPAGPLHSALPSPDDAFWSSSEVNYGSLPTRSRKRSLLSNRSSSASKDLAMGSQSFRRQAGRALVSSTLFEEGDESQDVRPAVEKKTESKNLNVFKNFGSKLSPDACYLPTDTVTPKSLSKISVSVPNLMKLKSAGSPFLPRRSKNSFLRPNLKPKEAAADVHICHDPRMMTKQMREQISNYVMTEDLCRKPNDPQLLGLKQLCSDFRDSCFQQNLRQRRKSIELMMKKGATCSPPLDPKNTGDVFYEKAERWVSKDDTESIPTSTDSKDLTGPLPEHSQTLPRIAKGARSHPLSGLWPRAADEQQNSSYRGDRILGTAEEQTTSVMESDEGLIESQKNCDVSDGFARPSSGTASFSCTFPTAFSLSVCINAEDEVTWL